MPEGRSRVGKRGSGGKNVGTRESGRSVDGMEGKRKMTWRGKIKLEGRGDAVAGENEERR